MKFSFSLLLCLYGPFLVTTVADVALSLAGASQTVALFNQLSVSYPQRANKGSLSSSLTYTSTGTGAGINMVVAGTAIASSSLNALPASNLRQNYMTVPQMAGSVVFIYNKNSFPGAPSGWRLVLPYDAPVKIYKGEITMWNDPYIQTANPTYTLPAQPIFVVTRADLNGGGTSAVRDSFHVIDPTWTYTGSTPWPYSNTTAAEQFEMISTVILTHYAIGYAGREQAVASDVSYAIIKNQAGNNVDADETSIAAALNSFVGPSLYHNDENYIGGSLANSNDPNAYTYVFFYYMVFPKAVTALDCAPYREVLRFIYWTVEDPDGRLLLSAGGFDPLPSSFFGPVKDLMKNATCNGVSLYGASPCDDGCVGGTCVVTTAWNPPDDICNCDVFHQNVNKTDCSEIANTQESLLHEVIQDADDSRFNMRFGGASQTVSLFSQYELTYPFRANRGVLTATVSYVAGGSGSGIQQVQSGFSIASSSLNSLPTNMNGLIAVPQFAGSVVFIYNRNSFPFLPIGQRLVLDREVLVKIYLGEVKMWNDPLITATNPGVTLPNKQIVVIARSDYNGGGTSSVRQTFQKIDPRFNASGPHDPWPYYQIMALKQYEMISYVILTPYSIGFSGYEQAIATDVEFAVIRNMNGEDLIPTQDSINAALESYLGPQLYHFDQNLVGGSINDSPAPGAYPFVFFYYAITKSNVIADNCEPHREKMRFIYWTINSTASKQIMENIGFVPLPPSIINAAVVPVMKNATCNGVRLYGASPCDDGCVGGTCSVVGLWNDPGDVCNCDVFHVNINKTDCSEVPASVNSAQQDAQTTAIANAAFNMIYSGASQTVALYQQFAVAFPRRANRGNLLAGLVYNAGGTSAGMKDIAAQRVLLASSLNALPPDPTKLVAIPQMVGSVVFIYNKLSFPNLAAGQKLVLPYDAPVKIYLGQITMWNDPVIQAANPGLVLPNQKIAVIARADYTGGATSSVRNSFAQMNSNWTYTGTTPWPYYTKMGREQFEMISYVILTDYSFGFCGYEQALASDLEFAIIKNEYGNNVIPSQDSITAALRTFIGPQLYHPDLNYIGGPISNADNPAAYPFVFFYYAIVQKAVTASDCRPYRETLRFIHWSLTSDDAQILMQNSGFKVLPAQMISPIVDLMKTVTCNGSSLYGASPCDNGCVGGNCNVVGLFNDPSDICQCDVDYTNQKLTDCSEARPAEFISYSDPIGGLAVSLSGIFAAYTVAVILLIWFNRTLPLIKALSPIFCIITLVGLLIEFAGIFVLVGQPTNSACSLQMWFLSLPLAFIFAAIIVKQYRLVTVFENKARFGLGIKNEHLLMLIGVIILPCIIFLSIYSGVAAPIAKRVMDQAGEYVWTCQPRNQGVQTGMFAMLGIYHLLLIVFSLLLANKGKKVRDEFNETKAIGLTVYILATVAFITVIVVSIPQLPSKVRFVIRAAAILFSSIAFTIVLFIKPLRRIKETKEAESVKSSKKTSNTQDGSQKMVMVKKDGVMVATQVGTKTSNSDSESDNDAETGPVKRMKEDTWQWQVYARPRKFLERWRRCYLTFHKELATISIIQRHHISDRTNAALTVCFPIKSLKVVYRGFNVTGGSLGSSNKFFKGLSPDQTAEEMEGLVLTFYVTTGDSFTIQMKSVAQAEQVVGLFTGTTLKDIETQGATSSRHGAASSAVRSSHVTGSHAKSQHSESESQSHHARSDAHVSKHDHAKSKAESDFERSQAGSEHEKSQVKSEHEKSRVDSEAGDKKEKSNAI